MTVGAKWLDGINLNSINKGQKQGKLMQMYSLHINGQAVSTQKTFDVINPATGDVFAKCALATKEHVDQAVAAARGLSQVGQPCQKQNARCYASN